MHRISPNSELYTPNFIFVLKTLKWKNQVRGGHIKGISDFQGDISILVFLILADHPGAQGVLAQVG